MRNMNKKNTPKKDSENDQETIPAPEPEARKHKGIFFELDYGKHKLDLKDKKIISIIGDNCRTPITAIGKAIIASRDSVKYRINNLIKKDIYRFC